MIRACRFFNIVILYLIMLPIAACSSGEGHSTETQEQADTALLRVAIMTAHPSRIVVYDELPGRVAAFRTAEIRPQVSGIVRKVVFEEGSEVSIGQPLFEIDPAPFLADVEAASAALARAEADQLNASLKYDRIKALVETRTATAAALADAQSTQAQARANVAEAKANLTRRKLELKHATVTSPINGRVGQALITEGGLASVGNANAMAVVQQLDTIYLDVRQPSIGRETLGEAFERGQGDDASGLPVDIQTITGKPYDYQGKVRFSDSSVDLGTGSIMIRVEVPNPYRHLLPGMFLRARVANAIYTNALTVPQEAIRRDSSGRPQLTIVGEDQTTSNRNVRLGPLVDRNYLILSGLSIGDKVVVQGHDRVEHGQKIKPVAYQPAPLKDNQ